MFSVCFFDEVSSKKLIVSIFTPLNTTTLLQKQTLLSQKHRLYRRRILPYQKYHLLRHRSHSSWNCHQFRRIHLSNHPCQHRLYLKFRLSSHPKYPWTRPNPLKWIDENNVDRLYFPDFYLED